MSVHPNNKQANLALAAYLRGERLPHAILLEGTGDETVAFAKEIGLGALCSAAPAQRPCRACRDCMKVEKEIHPDILEYTGGESSLSFHVDTVRTLRQEAYIRPNEGACKVMILRDVQNMTPQAANALLKIIEEPPAGVIFILTTNNKAALLETILSRVTVISLQPGEETPTQGQDAEAHLVLEALCAGNELDALAKLSALEKDKEALKGLLESIADEVRGALGTGSASSGERTSLRSRVSPLRLLQILAIIEDALAAIPQNVNRLLLVTNLCAKVKMALTR